MKHRIIEATILALGFCFIGLMLYMGINSFKDKDRVVSVKGLAEMEVPANKITWPLMYKDLGDDPLTLYNNINTKNKAIVAFLKTNGIAETGHRHYRR